MRRILLKHNMETNSISVDIGGFNENLTKDDVVGYIATIIGFFNADEGIVLEALEVVDRAREIAAQKEKVLAEQEAKPEFTEKEDGEQTEEV